MAESTQQEYLTAGSMGSWSDVDINSTIPTLLTDSLMGIYGMPYQWMDVVDRPLSGTDFGRMYATKIVARMPLLYLTPGRPGFMGDGGFKGYDKNNVLQSLIAGGQSKVEDILEGEGMYYNFDFKYDQYFAYVNPMLWTMARLMNVENYRIKLGKKDCNLGSADWSQALSSDFNQYFSISSAVPFYLDSEVSVSESLSNETTESWLASQAKSMQDQVKELDFILGSANGKNVDLGSGILDAKNSAFSKIANSSSSAKSIMGKIANSMSSIATGGRLRFPQIWSDGSMGRSYQCTIKLRSPDCDNLSLYLNIVVPFIHLLAFVAPQMMWNSNAYSSPFLVRAFYRSMFNVDMGIITDMSITKGKEGAWNVNGIPTEMDISITIKDLYDTFCISGLTDSTGIVETIKSIFGSERDSVKKFVTNTSMIDYLSNLAGLNMNRPSIIRNLEIYTMLKTGQFKTYPQRKLLQLNQAIDNMLNNIYRP